MSRSHSIYQILILILCGACFVNRSHAQPKPLLDKYGDPLPKHALLRLGTVRFTHGSPIRGIFISPDNKTITSVDSDGFLRVWETRTGKELHVLRLQTNGIEGPVALSPNRKLLASVTADGICVWSRGNGRVISVLNHGQGEVKTVSKPFFSGDSKRLFALVKSGHVLEWKIAADDSSKANTRRLVDFPKDDSTAISCSDICPARSLIATARTHRQGIHVWDMSTGKLGAVTK